MKGRSNMSLKISEFKKCDVSECAKLLVKTVNEKAGSDVWNSVYDAQVYLDEYLDNAQFLGFVAKESDSITGVCMGHTRSYHTGIQYIIDEFYIDESTKEAGTDHLLIRFVKQYLADDDIHVIIYNGTLNDDDFWSKNEFVKETDKINVICTF